MTKARGVESGVLDTLCLSFALDTWFIGCLIHRITSLCLYCQHAENGVVYLSSFRRWHEHIPVGTGEFIGA